MELEPYRNVIQLKIHQINLTVRGQLMCCPLYKILGLQLCEESHLIPNRSINFTQTNHRMLFNCIQWHVIFFIQYPGYTYLNNTHFFMSRERTSLYHSLGTSMFEFIPAMLTFDHAQINRTLAALKVSISICNQHRKNFTFVESIGTIIKKVEYFYYIFFILCILTGASARDRLPCYECLAG